MHLIYLHQMKLNTMLNTENKNEQKTFKRNDVHTLRAVRNRTEVILATATCAPKGGFKGGRATAPPPREVQR